MARSTAFKPALLLAFCLGAVAPASHAGVLTFDDLNGFQPPGPPVIQEEWFTSVYNGFRFGDLSAATNSWFYSQRAVPGLFGPSSGLNFAATDATQYTGALLESLLPGRTISSADDFVFEGASFAGQDQIQFELFNDGALVFTSAVFHLTPGVHQFLASGYGGAVDEINIRGTQGYYAMDDFSYRPHAVPEPGALALVLIGAAGLGLSRRVALGPVPQGGRA